MIFMLKPLIRKLLSLTDLVIIFIRMLSELEHQDIKTTTTVETFFKIVYRCLQSVHSSQGYEQ